VQKVAVEAQALLRAIHQPSAKRIRRRERDHGVGPFRPVVVVAEPEVGIIGIVVGKADDVAVVVD
jgi:hypothetical protein